MDILSTISMASGMAWASGFRLYAVVFIAGLMNRFEWVRLPGDLTILSNPWVLGISGVLCVVEFLADKIAVVDSVWDTVHTFIRIPAGAILAAAAMGTDANPLILAVAALLGGTVSGATHAAKATTRAAINASPEPVSNVTTSFIEEGMFAGGTTLMFLSPLLFVAALSIFLVFAVLITWALGSFVRKMWRKLFGKKAPVEPDPEPA
jgi:Domain of unknown function (DUF4126)